LLVIEDGSLLLDMGASTRRVVSGDIVLAQPGQVRSCRAPNSARYWCLSFDVTHRRRRQLAHKVSWMCIDPGPQPDARSLWGVDLPLLLPAPCLTRTQLLVRRIANRWWRSDVDQFICNTMLSGWIGWIVDLLIRPQAIAEDPTYRDGDAPAPSTLQSGSDAVVDAADDSARRGFTHGLTVADLATEAGMDRDAFARRYHRVRGVTPGAMLANLRYSLAEKLLRTTKHSVAIVARQAGFRSASAFTRGFVARLGVSPGVYRRHAGSG
jgi:AraC-like DNA-binding protein